MRKLVLVTFSATGLATGAAVAEPPLGSRLGSEVRSERKEDEASAARRGHVFASCMVNKRQNLAKRVVAQVDEKGYAAAYKAMTSGEIECFNAGLDDATHLTHGWRLDIPPAVLRGLLAEQLIKHDWARYAALPALPRQLTYSRPWYAGTTRYEAVDEMATCASETAPAATLALLKTEPYSDLERAAFGTIAPTLGGCLRAGFELGANRQALRSALAEAMYQRIASPPPVPTADVKKERGA